ncbi:MAG: ABC transporter ATP-binding protein [Phycisphaerales bacterium]|nr:ABC transporter ATP-binding protein/permease [Phycisphaerae bacterium]NNF42145.1 ABC transporter ATP-binding protein [Phycisphaerales bacterium]NNM24786.1 ABC transporter ATP-binding protein [Phycisphaerales bacterium]
MATERATTTPSRRWTLPRLLRPHRGALIVVVLLLALLACANMALPFCLKILVDDVFPGADAGGRWELIWYILPGLAVIYVLRNALFFASRLLSATAGEDVCFRMRSRLYEHLQQMSFSFYQSRQVGNLGSRVMDDTQTILMFIQQRLPALILNGIMLCVLLTVLFVVNWQLAIVSSLVLPLHFLTYRHFLGPIKQSHATAQDTLATAYGSLIERLLGMEVVKSFVAEKRECATFDSTIASAKRSFLRSHKYLFAQKVAADLLIGIATIGLLGFGAWHVTVGVMTTGDFFMFFGYVMMLYPTVLETLSGSGHLTRARASIDRVAEIAGTHASDAGVFDTTAAAPVSVVRGAIVFEDVHFAYAGADPVLAGVSLEIDPGERVAIIGPSGAGKTTLASMIPRFNDPTSGRVLVDGVDVARWPVGPLRTAIGIAFQEVFLFNRSILENVLYGRYDATVEEIIDACKLTGAHEFIDRLPVGYGSTPNELGGRFSRGERQRLTLARALIKNPQVLILDEATASLDASASADVLERVFDRMQGRTVLVITHDQELARLADRVVTIDRGVVTSDVLATEATALPGA